MKRFLKFCVGVFLIPCGMALTVSFYRLLVVNSTQAPHNVWALPIGFSVWVLVFLFLPRPLRAYVLAHELSHSFWGLLMGAKTYLIKVTKRGGYTDLSRSNFLIALAPYFFPFYTFLVILLHGILSFFFDLDPWESLWLGLVGFTWSFHLTFTVAALSRSQPDLKQHGYIFSYAVIYILNLVGISTWLVVTGDPEWLFLVEVVRGELVASYCLVWQWSLHLWVFLRSLSG